VDDSIAWKRSRRVETVASSAPLPSGDRAWSSGRYEPCKYKCHCAVSGASHGVWMSGLSLLCPRPHQIYNEGMHKEQLNIHLLVASRVVSRREAETRCLVGDRGADHFPANSTRAHSTSHRTNTTPRHHNTTQRCGVSPASLSTYDSSRRIGQKQR
jgi:hypothetical protein